MNINRITKILERTLYKELKRAGRPELRSAISTVREQIKKYPGKPSPKGRAPARRTGKYAKLIKIRTKFARVRTQTGQVWQKSGITRMGGESIIAYLRIGQSSKQKILGTPGAKHGRYRPLSWPPINESRIVDKAGKRTYPVLEQALLKELGKIPDLGKTIKIDIEI